MSAAAERKEFQAEVRKLLDIVIHSLYTEKEVFLRELVSNAADALEKIRHQSLVEAEVFDGHLPLEVRIDLDDKEKTLTITDTGIGMDREELEKNLGTIAHSGSRTFLANLEQGRDAVNLIGQFGVGFYAVFMVAAGVRVQSRSWRKDSEGWEWASDGEGSYSISPCPGIRRGTRIVVQLKEDAGSYADRAVIERIVRQYSSFVSFPILVQGEAVNTVQAIWGKNRDEITDQDYSDFYKYIAASQEEPLFRLHFSVDAPLAIHSLLFVPKENVERLGFGRGEPGVNLYCQKVLIEQHSENILPDWLRFLKGVVDSDDLPLNISRQALQDNALVAKIRKILTKKFLKFLEEQAAKDPVTYAVFWKTFGIFIKEGASQDFIHREELARLLRFESSRSEAGVCVSLCDYVARMPEGQKDIYYISGANRTAIESGPYVEAFRRRNIEILYTLEPVDDFVLNHLRDFEDRKLVSADRADLELPEMEATEEKKEGESPAGEPLAAPVLDSLIAWIKQCLGGAVQEVRASKRLVDSPAMVTNPNGFMTSSMERVLRLSGQNAEMHGFSGKDLEINPGHALIRNLAALRAKDEDFAAEMARQILDNAFMQAGLPVDAGKFVTRGYRIMERIGGDGQ